MSLTQKLSEWPSESEAAAILGTSTKTIARYAAKGLIEIRKRPRDGKKPENVCHPRDIEKLKPTAHVMPHPAPAPRSELALAERDRLPLVPSFEAVMRTISTAITSTDENVRNAKILNEKLVLTLKEASRSGFSMAFLRRAVDNGTLKSFRDGRKIKIARASLEEFARQGAV